MLTQQKLKVHYESAISPMGFVSPDKLWLHANSSLCALLGYTLQELQSTTLNAVTHPEDLIDDVLQFDNLINNNAQEYTTPKRFVHKNGTTIEAKQTLRSVVREDGTIDYVAIQIEDTRPQKQIAQALRHYEAQVFMLMALIDTAHDPVFVVDVDSKLQIANAAGHDLLSSTNLIKVIEGKISFLRIQYQSLLVKAIKQAVNKQTSTEIVLPSEEQNHKWWMTVVPLRKPSHLQIDLWLETAVVLLHDSSAKTHHISEFLRNGYGLKAAEIRLAEALAKGMTPEDYATSAGLQISTVRTQLRSIFIKTGTNRQADLVRLMSDVPRVRREVIEAQAIDVAEEQLKQDQLTICSLMRRIHEMDVMDRITQMSLAHDEPEAMLRGVLDMVRDLFDADRAGLLYPCDPDAPNWASFMESTKPEWVTPIPVGTITPMTPEVQELFREVLTCESVVVYDSTTANQVPTSVAEKYSTRSQMLIALKPKIGKPWLFGLVHCTDGVRYTEEQQKLLTAIGQRLSDRLGVINSLKQLRESEEKFRNLFEHSPIGLFHSTTEGKLLTANPAIAQIWGYENSAELLALVNNIGQQIFVNENQYAEISKAMKQKASWVQHEAINRRKDGSEITIQMTGRKVLNPDLEIAYIEGFVEDITQKKLSQELLWKHLNYDSLTQLPNRYMFQERLQQEIIKSKQNNSSLTLLLIGLDHFKEVNDTLGHYAGDRLLKEAARRIEYCVPEMNALARLGGDEFTVVLSKADGVHRADTIADCILQALSLPFQIDEDQAYISASIGITTFPADTIELDDLLKNADQALSVAKCCGRNRYAHFTPSLQVDAHYRHRLISDLRGALAANQFRVYFQPIVDLSSGQTRKAEALLRWMHPERGTVSPAEFIPVTEETGMIIEIGEWVFREAAKWSKRWSNMINDCFQVSVNKSPVQMHNASRQDDWVEYLHSQGLTGSNIVVEITEGMLIKAGGSEAKSLLGLRDGGIQVAIDDFGTGYSSLAYLNKFDIDYLKIDQSFIHQITSDTSTMALPEAIIVMAHRLGLKVIAEGIETKTQLQLLEDAGCDFGQGYFFSTPLPPEEFEKLIVVN